MAKKNTGDMAKIFEHFCNDDLETSNALIHKFIVEQARDIHSEMIANEETLREEALDGDMEDDLAHDIKDIHHSDEGEEGLGDEDVHGAEEDLTSEMLGGDEGGEESHDDLGGEEEVGDDMFGDEEHSEGGEEGVEGELESHEEGDEHQEVEVEVEDRLENLEDQFDHIKAIFAELAGEEEGMGEEVAESTELSPVKAGKKDGEVGDGESTGMATGKDAKSPFNKVAENKPTVGGDPVEIGKGPTHKGYERETPPSHKDLAPGAVNAVKSSKTVLNKVSKVPEKGEVGSGKSGMPVEGNTTSVFGSKK